MKKLRYFALLALIPLFIKSTPLWASPDMAREGALVKDPTGRLYKLIKGHPDLIIDHRTSAQFEVYGPLGTIQWLNQIGAHPHSFAEEFNHSQKIAVGYPSPEEIEDQLKEITQKYSKIMKLISIGQTSSGRDIWVVKISDNPEEDELEPEVKYIANMHGDEIVGREMMIRFLRDMGSLYMKSDKAISTLVNHTEIFIMPSMNPDGAARKRRGNSGWKDLNRNFPDFSTRDNQNDSHGREEETVAVMNWQDQRNFTLSANFHGGTKVVNYPWDTSSKVAPLTQLIISLSKEYADQVPGFYDSTEFEGGIVNGNEWYEVDGGMQDWSYYYYNDLQVTIELSHSKWPNYKYMDQFFQDNKRALYQFLRRSHQGHGLSFQSRDAKSVEVINSQTKKIIGKYPVRNQQFYKVLPQGKYQFIIEWSDGSKISKNIEVSFDPSKLSPKYLFL